MLSFGGKDRLFWAEEELQATSHKGEALTLRSFWQLRRPKLQAAREKHNFQNLFSITKAVLI
jgi:hypothetical protein